MTPSQLSEELRNGDSPDMTRRRAIIALSVVGAAMGHIVSLYQTGIVRRLPDPPVSVFDSEKVDASDYAYSRMDTPDAFMMTTSYAITGWLAGAGGIERAEKQPLIPVLMGLKTAMDVAVTLELTREEWNENKALCFYCQIGSLVSFIAFLLSIPEAFRALQRMADRR